MIFLFAGIFADVIAPYGFNQIMPINRMKPPSAHFWFGTDNLGRDILSRVIYGAALSVIIGLSAASLATIISVSIASCRVTSAGKFDMLVQRFVDAWLSFPGLVILIVVVAVVGPGMPQVIGILGVQGGIGGSRIIRSAVNFGARAELRACRAVDRRESIARDDPPYPAERDGAGDRFVHDRRRQRHPGRVRTVVPRLGVPPPAPTWGGMLTGSARNYMYLAMDGAGARHLSYRRGVLDQHVRRRLARPARSKDARNR